MKPKQEKRLNSTFFLKKGFPILLYIFPCFNPHRRRDWKSVLCSWLLLIRLGKTISQTLRTTLWSLQKMLTDIKPFFPSGSCLRRMIIANFCLFKGKTNGKKVKLGFEIFSRFQQVLTVWSMDVKCSDYF